MERKSLFSVLVVLIAFMGAMALLILALRHGHSSGPQVHKEESRPGKASIAAHTVAKVGLAPEAFVRPWRGLCAKGVVRSVEDFAQVVSRDPALQRHYATFAWSRARLVPAPASYLRHVAHREGDAIYWTRLPLSIREGESLISDGERTVRTHCCNEVSLVPREPVAFAEPFYAELQPPGAETMDAHDAVPLIPAAPLGGEARPALPQETLLWPPAPSVPGGGGWREIQHAGASPLGPSPIPTPEPSTSVLVGLGLLVGMVLRVVEKRRRRP